MVWEEEANTTNIYKAYQINYLGKTVRVRATIHYHRDLSYAVGSEAEIKIYELGEDKCPVRTTRHDFINGKYRETLDVKWGREQQNPRMREIKTLRLNRGLLSLLAQLPEPVKGSIKGAFKKF